METPWKKIFALIKRTGERCLVVDPDSDEIFVVSDLQNYERLLDEKMEITDVTEEELLDKINRDIAAWQSTKDLEFLPQKNMTKSELLREAEVDDDRYYIEPVE